MCKRSINLHFACYINKLEYKLIFHIDIENKYTVKKDKMTEHNFQGQVLIFEIQQHK
jgi:hypothetical protein